MGGTGVAVSVGIGVGVWVGNGVGVAVGSAVGVNAMGVGATGCMSEEDSTDGVGRIPASSLEETSPTPVTNADGRSNFGRPTWDSEDIPRKKVNPPVPIATTPTKAHDNHFRL